VKDRRRWPRSPRRGATLLLAALLMVLLLAVVAFAVDIGRIVLVRTQLQVAADSAALAAASEVTDSLADRVAIAQRYADAHRAGGTAVKLNAADVVFGVWDYQDRTYTASDSLVNAIQVTARRDKSSGGRVPLLFGRVLGTSSSAVSAEAIAVIPDNFLGFRTPPSPGIQPILPFALDKATWDALLAGSGSDALGWDPESKQVTAQADGTPEAKLFPIETGSGGNCGTVDIANDDNSTDTLVRQILGGISADDLAQYGGKLSLDFHGELQLMGNPGISAGVKDEIATIVGQTRIIPIFSNVVDNGNNATYTIVQFAGIRILAVRLTGSDKGVYVQPAAVKVEGGIPATGTDRKSYYIYSRVHLVR
jgi:hypothetical protein